MHHFSLPEFSDKSEFQQVDVFESKEFGKFLTLDGLMMVNYKDEFIKNEILRVLFLPELNKWKSAQTEAGKAEYEIIFYLNIDKKK